MKIFIFYAVFADRNDYVGSCNFSFSRILFVA